MKMIPMFPLSILPLPGEMVPLHIFEPRYKELLQDAEADDFYFGIYFNHVMNVEKIGSLVKLESVIKRFPNGESDIIVKCYNIFKIDTLYRTYKTKMYPGGDVTLWTEYLMQPSTDKLHLFFHEYLERKKSKRQVNQSDIYTIANELTLELMDRYQFLTTADRDKFLITKIKYLMELLKQEERSRDVFHLN